MHQFVSGVSVKMCLGQQTRQRGSASSRGKKYSSQQVDTHASTFFSALFYTYICVSFEGHTIQQHEKLHILHPFQIPIWLPRVGRRRRRRIVREVRVRRQSTLAKAGMAFLGCRRNRGVVSRTQVSDHVFKVPGFAGVPLLRR